MIAKRFQSVGRVAMGAVAAMGLYLITSQVAAERTELERVNRHILAAKKDIRQLETELGTRANLRQLERWNGEVLALSTPDADQFLQAERQLASLDRSGITPGPRYAPTAMVTAMVALPDAPLAETVKSDAVEVKDDSERRALIAEARKPEKPIMSAKAEPKAKDKPKTRREVKSKPVALAKAEPAKKIPAARKAPTEKPKRLAQVESRLLGDSLMGELSRKAKAEGRAQ